MSEKPQDPPSAANTEPATQSDSSVSDAQSPEGASPGVAEHSDADGTIASSSESSESQSSGAESAEAAGSVEDRVIAMIQTVYDPEIPVNIHELGLIYGVDLADDGSVAIRMTLTSPNCPAAESLPGEVETKVGTVPGVTEAKVEIVWDPTWTPDLMSEAAKLELGMW